MVPIFFQSEAHNSQHSVQWKFSSFICFLFFFFSFHSFICRLQTDIHSRTSLKKKILKQISSIFYINLFFLITTLKHDSLWWWCRVREVRGDEMRKKTANLSIFFVFYESENILAVIFIVKFMARPFKRFVIIISSSFNTIIFSFFFIRWWSKIDCWWYLIVRD